MILYSVIFLAYVFIHIRQGSLHWHLGKHTIAAITVTS